MSDLETLLRRNRQVRTLGIDDAPFRRGQKADVLVVGALCAGVRFEGLLTTHVRPDGLDATSRLVEMVCGSKFHAQIHAVLLDGVTLGGFNVVDLPDFQLATDRPVVSVMRQRPDLEAMNQVLARLPQPDRRRRALERAGPIHQAKGVFFQAHGIAPTTARTLLDRVTDQGRIPESLRLAHLIGRGVVTGESGRRA